MRKLNRRQRASRDSNYAAISYLSLEQKQLLRAWLKSDAQSRQWDALLKLAQASVETAYDLLEFLYSNGLVDVEETLAHTLWAPLKISWRDYEALCLSLGIVTRSREQLNYLQEWEQSLASRWYDEKMQAAYLALRDISPKLGKSRLVLLTKLNQWCLDGRTGNRRVFSVFAFGQTKYQISDSAWNWLDENFNLSDCGIYPHTPLLFIAGDVRMHIDARILDVAASGHFVGLSGHTIERCHSIESGAQRYRLIENLTSFEYMVHNCASSEEIIIWLPGYAPGWWVEAVTRLLQLFPAAALISCDADPDGVQIACQAGRLWTEQNLTWQPDHMSVNHIRNSRHHLAMTEDDIALAQQLLETGQLPAALSELLVWCLTNHLKAEQENWLG